MYWQLKRPKKIINGNFKVSQAKRLGGDGEKIQRYNAANKNICGKFDWKRYGKSN